MFVVTPLRLSSIQTRKLDHSTSDESTLPFGMQLDLFGFGTILPSTSGCSSVRGLEIKLVVDLSSLFILSPSWWKGRSRPLVRRRRDRSRHRIKSLSSHSPAIHPGPSDRPKQHNDTAIPYPTHRFLRFDFSLYVSRPNRRNISTYYMMYTRSPDTNEE